MITLTPIAMAALLALGAPPAATTNLALDIRSSAGSSSVVVAPGRVAHYQIVGTLSDSASDGLAYFSTNLAFSGGPLVQAANPSSAPMTSFSPPLGFANPAGFGGTLVAGQLLQVGGAQNTIHNTIAPAPIGTVQIGIAQPSAPQVLVTGDVVAPYTVGMYTLSASGSKANVIRAGQSGSTFYKVDKVGNTSSIALTVEVQAITARPAIVSVGIGQEQHLALDAGPANAGRAYQCLGSLSGTAGGYQLPNGGVLPLHPDGYLNYTLTHPNSAILQNSLGVLDSNGRAVVTFHPDRRFVGMTVDHAFFLSGSTPEFVSEAEAVQVVP
jgi:hypothetical protein